MNYKIKICEYCGKEFKAKTNCFRYCCEECRSSAEAIRLAAYKIKLKERRKYKYFKYCETCGKKFRPKNKHEKYCNINCELKKMNKLDDIMSEIIEYNKKHNTFYSYGKYIYLKETGAI